MADLHGVTLFTLKALLTQHFRHMILASLASLQTPVMWF